MEANRSGNGRSQGSGTHLLSLKDLGFQLEKGIQVRGAINCVLYLNYVIVNCMRSMNIGLHIFFGFCWIFGKFPKTAYRAFKAAMRLMLKLPSWLLWILSGVWVT